MCCTNSSLNLSLLDRTYSINCRQVVGMGIAQFWMRSQILVSPPIVPVVKVSNNDTARESSNLYSWLGRQDAQTSRDIWILPEKSGTQSSNSLAMTSPAMASVVKLEPSVWVQNQMVSQGEGSSRDQLNFWQKSHKTWAEIWEWSMPLISPLLHE